MSDGPWRTPSGGAPVLGFAGGDELVAGLLEHVALAAELALAQRVRAGEISDRADAASTYFLEPARVRTLVHGAPPAPAAEQELAVAAARRDQALLARLADTPHALALGFARWELADDDRRVVLALLAATLSPRISRLLALLGGDPAVPVVTADAIAALLAPGDAGARRLADRLGSGQPLAALGLVHLGRPELPLPRRPIALTARVQELAFDRLAVDPACGGVRVAPTAGAVTDEVRGAVEAVTRRGVRTVVGALSALHDGIGTLAAALAEVSQSLIAAPLAAALDATTAAGLVREVLLHAGVLALEIDAASGLLGGAAIERIAARVPTVLVFTRSGTLPRLAIATIAIPARPATNAQIAAVLERRLAGAFDVATVPALPSHLLAIGRGLDALEARGLPPADLFEVVVEQLVPVPPPGVVALLPDGPPEHDEQWERVARHWIATDAPRRLAVLVSGARGLGKLRLAASIAQRLGIPAFQLDPAIPIDPGFADAIAVGAAVAVLHELSEEEIRRLRGNSWWIRTHGLLVVTTTRRLDMTDAADFDLQIRLEAPTAPERADRWTRALAARKIVLPGAAIGDLARFPLNDRQIAMLVRITAEPTLAALVAAIQHELER